MAKPVENICTLLVKLHEYVENEKEIPDTVSVKADLCDNINSKITEIIQQVLCMPYTTNFNLRIDKETPA
jgi:predicted PP-loop superfamily ATPase